MKDPIRPEELPTPPPVRGPRLVLRLDALAHLALAGLLALDAVPGLVGASDPYRALGAIYALLAAVMAAGASRRAPAAMVWRRRLGLVAVVAVLWVGGPARPALQASVVLETGAAFVALLLLARRQAHDALRDEDLAHLGDD